MANNSVVAFSLLFSIYSWVSRTYCRVKSAQKIFMFFYHWRPAQVQAGLSKYDNGTYTKHLHKTIRHDSISIDGIQ